MRQYADSGLVALDLVNTWDAYLDDPELLPTVASLRRFCVELAEPGASTVRGADLAAVRALRDQLRRTLSGEPDDRTNALAALADDLPARIQVTANAGIPNLQLTSPAGADLATRLGVRALRELLDLATAGDWLRIRVCSATPCHDVFIDRSRPGRRRFCSTRCANRLNATNSRARQWSDGQRTPETRQISGS